MPALKTNLFLRYALLSLLTLLVFLLIRTDPTSEECDLYGDFNVIALSVDAAKHFAAYVGPYSRHQFFHPGPIFFYLYALVDQILVFVPQGFPRFTIAQALINFFLLLLTQHLVLRYFKTPILSWLPLLLALLIFPNTVPSFLGDIWGPTSLLCPMLVFLVSAAVFASGKVEVVFPLVISGSLMASNHVGSLSLTVPVGLIALIDGLMRRRAEGSIHRSELIQIYLSLFALCIFWILPIVESVSAPRWGNFGAILDFVMHRSGHHSLDKSISFIASFANAPFRFLIGASELANYVSLVGLIVIPYIFHLDRASPLSRLRLLLTVSYTATIYAAMRITGGQHPFILWFLYSVVVLSIFVIVSGVLKLLCIEEIKRKEASAALQVALALGATGAILLTQSFPMLGSCPTPNPYRNMVLRLSLNKDQIYIVRTRYQGGVSWERISKVVYALRRSGFNACVDKQWGYVFGNDNTCVEMSRTRSLRNFSILELVAQSRATPEELKAGVLAQTTVGVVRDMPAKKIRRD